MADNAEDATDQGSPAQGPSGGTDNRAGVSGAPGTHDMGGDIGPTPPSSRGGGGLGPQEVRDADAHARGDDRPGDATGDQPGEATDDRPRDEIDDDKGPAEQGGTYHGEGVGRQEQVSSGPATGTPGNPHPPQVHHSNAPDE